MKRSLNEYATFQERHKRNSSHNKNMIEFLHTHIKEKICLYLLRMDGGAYNEKKGITWNNRKYGVGKREDEIK